MNKLDFLNALQDALSGLPQEDINERLMFYSEMIDDRMEEGLSEEEAVAGVGSIDDIVSQTVADVPITKLVKERVKPSRSLRGGEIALLILGFPLWFPLLIAGVAVIFSLVISLYAVLWSLIISLWAVEVSLWACALAGIAVAVMFFIKGNVLPALAMLGIGLFSAGLSILLFFGCVAATKGAAVLTKKIALGIKKMFVRKERTK
ncbi:MAG: DUF1700 domain-containing protein [Clostridia bacterium]|nr:DUF1700 domain-containing protein [Clostridia bacterium]